MCRFPNMLFNWTLFIILFNCALVLTDEIENVITVIEDLDDLYKYRVTGNPLHEIIESNNQMPTNKPNHGDKDGRRLLVLNGSDIGTLELSPYVGRINEVRLMFHTNAENVLKIVYIFNDGDTLSSEEHSATESNWSIVGNENENDAHYLVAVKAILEGTSEHYFILDKIVISTTRADTCNSTGEGYFPSERPGEYFRCVWSPAHQRWLMYRFSCPLYQGNQQIFDPVQQKCIPAGITTTTTTTTTNTRTTDNVTNITIWPTTLAP